MNLRKLAHLLAVVESRNMRVAAEAVHLSQPALSRSLKSLEDELGITLLDRAYGRILPTGYSEPVLQHIRNLSAEGRALRETVRRLKGLEEGSIRVGFGPFTAATALRPIARDLVSRYPNLRLHIELASSPLLIELLHEDRLDLVVCDSRYLEDGDLAVTRLPKQPVGFLAGRDHPLHSRGRIGLEELKSFPIGAPKLPVELLTAFRDHGFDDFPSVACEEVRLLLELATCTPLVVMVPQVVIDTLLEARELVALPVDVPFDPYAYPCIIHGRAKTLGPAASLLIRLVQQQLAQVPDPRRTATRRVRSSAGATARKARPAQ